MREVSRFRRRASLLIYDCKQNIPPTFNLCINYMGLPNRFIIGGNYTFSDIYNISNKYKREKGSNKYMKLKRDQSKKKRSKKKRSKKKQTKKKRYNLINKRSRLMKCKCNNRYVNRMVKSPSGYGICPNCTPIDRIMYGTDRNLWKNKSFKSGNRWIKVTN